MGNSCLTEPTVDKKMGLLIGQILADSFQAIHGRNLLGYSFKIDFFPLN